MQAQESKHYKHELAIWELQEYIVNIAEESSVDLGNSQWDDNPPVWCKTCHCEIEGEEGRALQEEAIRIVGNV